MAWGCEVKQQFRRRSELRFVGYRSFGPPDRLVVRGRVLANRPGRIPALDESTFHRFGRMAGHFLTREVAGVEVEVRLGHAVRRAVTDAEGYLYVTIPAAGLTGWVNATAHIIGHGDDRSWAVPCLVIEPGLQRVLISDIDDTILENGQGDLLRTAWATVSGSSLTRRPIDGAATLYRACAQDGPEVCQAFFVSSSPWNLYDFLIGFLEHHSFPEGPLVLRDIGLNRSTLAREAHRAHKVTGITGILDACPSETSAVLIGDSSQHDADAFANIMNRRPDQVEAAFIRDVGDPAAAARVASIATSLPSDGPPLILFESFEQVRAELEGRGWLTA